VRLLWITPYLPHPPIHGGKVRALSLIAHIGSRHEVHLIAVNDTDLGQPPYGPLETACASVTLIPHRKRSGLTGRIMEALSPLPRPVWQATFAQGVQVIENVLAGHSIDAAVVEQMQTARYIHRLQIRGIPALIDCQNVERRVWEGFVRYPPSFKFSLRARLEVLKFMRFERWALRAAAGRVTVSREDRDELERIGGRPCVVAPNGVDAGYFAFRPRRHRLPDDPWQVVMTGDMGYLPNVEGAEYFLSAVLPRLRREHPHVVVCFVGNRPDARLLAWQQRDDSVRFTGIVDDVRPYVADADIFIAPLRLGGGTRLKLLEAMAQGIPIVTTSVGCEGLDVIHGEHVWMADTPDAFCHGITTLMRERELAHAMAQRARAHVELRYSWDQIAAEFERELLRCVWASRGVGDTSSARRWR